MVEWPKRGIIKKNKWQLHIFISSLLGLLMMPTTEQTLQQGIAAHREGKLKDAERLYRAILKSQPLHPDANHNLGVLAVSVNKPNTALPLFKRALEANPKIEQFWFSYIDTLIKEKQFDNANQVIEKGKKEGISGEILNVLEARLNSINEAEKLGIESPSEEQLNCILVHYNNGRFDDAEKLAIYITGEFPQHPFGWKVLGALFSQSGRYTEAVDANQTAVSLSPQDSEVHNNLGITLQKLGRLGEAIESYTQAIKIFPQDAEAHNNLGIALQEVGRLDEAIASYTQAIALEPYYAEANINLGVTLQVLGRLEEAEASYMQAIKLKPRHAGAHYNLGNTLKELGRLDEAEESYRQAIMLGPRDAEVNNNLGVTLQELGKLDEALEIYIQAIVLKPDYAEAHNNLGVTLEELGKLDEAEESYKKAIIYKNGFGEAKVGLGRVLLLKGKHKEGLDQIRRGNGAIILGRENWRIIE